MKRTHAWRNLSLAVVLGICCAAPLGALAAEKFVPPARPIPLAPEPPPLPAAPTPSVGSKPFTPPQSASSIAPFRAPQPAQKPVVVTNPTVTVPPAPKLQPATYLAWDAESKEVSPKIGETSAHFTFWLTNVSKEVVAVNSVRTSCGCTVAQLPAQPWRLEPGTNGPIEVAVNLVGKSGTIMKSVTVDSTAGVKSLIVKVNIPAPTNAVQVAAGGVMGDVDRIKNMQATLADRQIVFKNKDCIKCHAEPATDKNGLAVLGQPLYQGVCANCHDSPNRASMVPNLHALNHPTSPELWKKWITSGRVGSMMPAFAKTEGGILTDEQINSLVEFLSKTVPSNPGQHPAPATAQPVQVSQPKQSASAK
jgi:mono/diheme cytochrome c family protein